jgi:hypothetical protein
MAQAFPLTMRESRIAHRRSIFQGSSRRVVIAWLASNARQTPIRIKAAARSSADSLG